MVKWTVLVLVLATTAVARAQDNLPRLPVWYDAWCELAERKLDGDWNTGMGYPTEETIARGAITTVDALPTTMDTYLIRMKKREWSAEDIPLLRTERTYFLRSFRQDVRAWIGFSRVEIKNLGASPERLILRIDSLEPKTRRIAEFFAETLKRVGASPDFADVPLTHWAADPIQRLRDAGVIVGFP